MKDLLRHIIYPVCGFISAMTINSSAVAQDSLARYHPLNKGNIWIFQISTLPARTFYKHCEVTGDTTIDGKNYRIIAETNSIDMTTSITVARYDISTGCYFIRSGPSDILEDSMFTFTPNSNFGGSSNCKVFKSLDTGTVLNTHTTTRQISEGKLIKEDMMSWSYSYGLGLVYQTDVQLSDMMPVWTQNLIYAKIDGKEYGTVPLKVNSKDRIVPTSIVLYQNYPNPFNPATIISFDLPTRMFVTLKVYDVLGKEVASIVSGQLEAGNHIRQWNAEGISSGVYFCRLQTGNITETKKVLLLK